MKDLKEKALPFSSPAPVLRKTPQKIREQQVKPTTPANSNTDVSASVLNAAENVNQDLECNIFNLQNTHTYLYLCDTCLLRKSGCIY